MQSVLVIKSLSDFVIFKLMQIPYYYALLYFPSPNKYVMRIADVCAVLSIVSSTGHTLNSSSVKVGHATER